MTKQMKVAMAALMLVGTLPMVAQTSQTDVVKVAPGQKKTTVVHRKNGATDTVVSEGVSTGTHKKRRTVAKRAVVHHEPVESATARELRELREKQVAQQAQIDALTAANAAKDAALTQAETDARGAEAQAQTATSQAQQVTAAVQANSDAVQALKSNVTDLQTTSAGLASTISANKVELTEKIESPLAIHYKGVTITPVGFFAAESVWRQRSINSDINTPFNTTPYPGLNEAHVSEFNFTARQSRLGGLFEGSNGAYKYSGYFEADFLSAGVTSNSNQSNSYTLRVRQIWGKAERAGFAVTGGQTWTLVTENGKSTDVRTEKLPNTIDPSYMVGYSWARQPGIRIQQKIGHPLFGAGVTVAIAAEQAQIIFAGTTNAPTNFFFGGAGTTGGLFNNGANYANNVAPDVITKIAFDSKHSHIEVGGLARFFRDRIYPAAGSTGTGVAAITGATPFNNTVFGGGGFASARVTSHYLDVALAGMVGDGTGRYGAAQLPDVTVHPNGTLEPIRNAHGLFSVESHPTKRLDIYAYYGGEYAQRTVYRTGVAATPLTGYGTINTGDTGCNTEVAVTTGTGVTGTPTAANCAAATRFIQEGMAGFTFKIINSPKIGQLRYQANYSYLTKSAWTGLTGGTYGVAGSTFGGPKATNNMINLGLRYYIP